VRFASTVCSFELLTWFGCCRLNSNIGVDDEGSKDRRYQADGSKWDPRQLGWEPLGASERDEIGRSVKNGESEGDGYRNPQDGVLVGQHTAQRGEPGLYWVGRRTCLVAGPQ
jgi:hypothetical protein